MSTPRPKADWAMILFHSFVATARRPGRSAATAVGIALGITVFLVTVGWSQTVGSQINQTFDELAATKIVVKDTQADLATESAFPTDTAQILSKISGVISGGRVWGGAVVPVSTSQVSNHVEVTTLYADPETLIAADVAVASGRLFTDSEIDRTAPVAVLGQTVAQQLGIAAVTPGLGIVLEDTGTPVMVIGILETGGSMPELDHAIILAPQAPTEQGMVASVPSPADTSVVVRVELGTAHEIAKQLPLALRPHDSARLGVLVPPEPASLRDNVQGSLDTLALGAASLSLLIGGIGIMNSMLNAVSQRAGEIGLRRSMGAARRHIVAQFLIEGAFLGLIGATVGVVAGEAVLIAISFANDWNPVLAKYYLAVAPVAGLLIGVLAALYPALRAATIKPAETLRA
ncbi:ABC transporter permease [Jonesiaceae bacterium BS-20]|uniref:ABC transporter permease n=1 Tax=Jonesiaceae bacterium BS-20 TaxID=3120821 RepID=A0AAU7DTB5_9MICO